MRYQIVQFEHAVLKLLFDGWLDDKTKEQIKQAIVGLYPYGVTKDTRYSEYADELLFALVPFFRTQDGFAELSRKVKKTLRRMGYKPL